MKIKNYFKKRKFSAPTVSVANKITSLFLMAILLGAVVSSGSLFSIDVESAKKKSQRMGNELFPNTKSNFAWAQQPPGQERFEVTEKCEDDVDEEKFKKIRDDLFETTDLGKQHPQFKVNKTKEIKVKGKSGEEMKMAQSPFAKMISEKQKNGNKFRDDITVNCHKLINAEKIPINATHDNYKLKTFTSVKIKPTNGTMGMGMGMPNEQIGWGPITVKNNGTINAPDMGLNLTNSTLPLPRAGEFRNFTDFAEVFVDSVTENGHYDPGEFIYSNVTTSSLSKVTTEFVRQFANYTNLPLEVKVETNDPDHKASPVKFFNATVRYYDRNSDSFFNGNDTAYLDTEPFFVVSANDIRLANAKFAGNSTDESEFHFIDGLKVSIQNGTQGLATYNSFIQECIGDKMGVYNYTDDTCDFTNKYGMQMKKDLEDMGTMVEFQHKGPDLKRTLLDFDTAVVFVDTNSNTRLDVGESIYLNHDGKGTKIGPGDIRLANSIHGEDGSTVKGGDPEVINNTFFIDLCQPHHQTEKCTSDYRYYDEDGSGNFTVGETIYKDDSKPEGKVNGMHGMKDGDTRLVNAEKVGIQFEDGSLVYKNGMFQEKGAMEGKNNCNGKKCEPIEIGFEDRQYNVTEDLELTVANNATNTTAAVSAVLSSLARPLSFDNLGVDENGQTFQTIEKDILFGNTIVPHVRFGFGINLETCFWIFGCVTWFKIGVWFTPYLIAGFRLPGRVAAYGVPDREFASKSFDINTDFEGADFSYKEFKDLCNDTAQSSLSQGGYFGPGTPFDCDDFASYDAMSIPTVIKGLSTNLTEIFEESGCTFDVNDEVDFVDCNFDRLPEAPGEFIKVLTVLFNPLPPVGIDDLKSRIFNAGLSGGKSQQEVNDKVDELLAGQEVVLKAGVVIEVDLVILNIRILDINERVEVDLLGMIQGFLLYNEIVKSSNPTIYNGKYAFQEKLSDNICKLDKIHDRCFFNGVNTCAAGFDVQNQTLDTKDIVEMDLVQAWTLKFDDRYVNDLNYTLPECEPSPRADYVAIWDLVTSYENMQDAGVVFTSFETPYGIDPEEKKFRTFPFLSTGENSPGVPVISNTKEGYNLLYLRGNCVEAVKTNQILKLPAPYGPLPFCTGLWAPGMAEAILGINAGLGSLKVDAQLLPEGDAASMPDTTEDPDFLNTCPSWNDVYNNPEKIQERKDDQHITYCAYLQDNPATNGTKSSNATRTITVDNYDARSDQHHAKIKIDKFLYNLQWIVQGDLLIAFEDPVKFFIPDEYKTVTIVLFVEDIPTGIKIDQHPRVFGLGGDDVFVINYAVGIQNDEDPINQPNGTKPMRPNDFETKYEKRSNSTVTYTNIGNSPDKIHNLLIEFPELSPDNPGIPWASIPNQAVLNSTEFNLNASETFNESAELVFGINPPRHWSTAPSYLPEVGNYNVMVYGSSSNATIQGMPEQEPTVGEHARGALRINATDVLKINVTQFGAPDINFTEALTQTFPGNLTEINATISNFGNGNDTIPLIKSFYDSNQSNCDLFEKHPDNPSCPYRAQYTVPQDSWTNYTQLCDVFWRGVLPCGEVPPPKPENQIGSDWVSNKTQQIRQHGLDPADSRSQIFNITIPGNWAGIDDTVYTINGTVLSDVDPEESDIEFANHTVIATKESSVRYVALEIEAMKNKVVNASVPDMIDKGSQNALTQILDKAIESANERAFGYVCEEQFKQTNVSLRTATKQLEGMMHAINGMTPSNIDPEFSEELLSNAQATIEDIEKASENNLESIVPCAEFSAESTNKAKKKELGSIRTFTEETTEESPSLSKTSESDTQPEPKSGSSSKIIETPKSQTPQAEYSEKENEQGFSWTKFDRWAGFSETNLSDKEFLEHLEIDGNEIPSWIKQNNANWVKQGLISPDDLVIALENLKNRGII